MKSRMFVIVPLFAVLFAGCKSRDFGENSGDAQSIRAKTLFGFHFGWGETHQLYFHQVQSGEVCAYTLDKNNSDKGLKGKTVGKMEQAELFKEFAKPLSNNSINFQKFELMIKPRLDQARAKYAALKTVNDQDCEKVAENRALVNSASCGSSWSGGWSSDNSICRNPITYKPMDSWAICAQRTKSVDCRPSIDSSCVPCKSTESSTCLLDSGKKQEQYEECEYSSSRDPNYSRCYNPNTEFVSAREAFETLNISVVNLTAEMQPGRQVAGKSIRNVNETALANMRKLLEEAIVSAKGTATCLPAAKIPL